MTKMYSTPWVEPSFEWWSATMAMRRLERERHRSMRKPRHLITLSVDELSAFRAAVIACAAQSEHGMAERLLGQLASLEASGQAVSRLEFVPAATNAPLALRALAHMRRDACRES
jgi:hypothetical protein